MLSVYQPWKGVTLWALATVADFIWLQSGIVSLSGFVAAIVWSNYGPEEVQ